jgi:hypothetical protein
VSEPNGGQRNLKLLLGMLLGIAIASSTFIGISASWSLPVWFGAAVGIAALVGALIVLVRQGAMRVQFVILFVAAIAAAPLLAWFLKV